MALSKGVTLKGATAGAFIEMMTGKAPKNEDDEYLRYATAIYMEMKVENTTKAVKLLKELVTLKAPKS